MAKKKTLELLQAIAKKDKKRQGEAIEALRITERKKFGKKRLGF